MWDALPPTNLIYILRLKKFFFFEHFTHALSFSSRRRESDERTRWVRDTFGNLHLLFGNHAWICIYLHFYFPLHNLSVRHRPYDDAVEKHAEMFISSRLESRHGLFPCSTRVSFHPSTWLPTLQNNSEREKNSWITCRSACDWRAKDSLIKFSLASLRRTQNASLPDDSKWFPLLRFPRQIGSDHLHVFIICSIQREGWLHPVTVHEHDTTGSD